MKLTKEQKTALKLIFEGDLSMMEIAKCVNRSRTTLYKWMKQNNFIQAFDCELAERELQNRHRINGLTFKALERAEKIITQSKNEQAAVMVIKDVLNRADCTADEAKTETATADIKVQIINDTPKE